MSSLNLISQALTGYGGQIARTLGEARRQAAAARARGQYERGRTLGQLAQTLGGIGSNYLQERVAAPLRELELRKLQTDIASGEMGLAKTAAEIERAEQEQNLKRLQDFFRLMAGATDQDSYLVHLDTAEKYGLVPPDVAETMRKEPFTKEMGERFSRLAMGEKEWQELQQKLYPAPVPGRDVPLPPEVEAQQMRLKGDAEPAITESRLAYLAAKGDKEAEEALRLLREQQATGGGYKPADILTYEYAKGQGYQGTLEDWVKTRPLAYGEIRSRQMIDPQTGRPVEVFPMTGRVEPAPEGLVTPTFASKAAEARAEFAAADALLRQVEEAANRVITAKDAPEAWVQNPSIRLGALLRTNPDAAVYVATREAFLSMLTRAAGEKGPLTDQDVDRIKNALPAEGDTREIAERKIKQLRGLFEGIRNARLKSYGTGGGQPASVPAANDPMGIF